MRRTFPGRSPWLLLVLVSYIGFSGTGCAAGDTGKPVRGNPVSPEPNITSGPKTAVLHPSFSLAAADLERLVAGVPSPFREKILGAPGRFLEMLLPVLDSETGLLVLVDKSHPLPDSFVPADLVRLKDYGFSVNRDTLELRAAVIDDFRKLADAARDAGYSLPVISAYRSYRYQITVYENHVATWGREAAERESAQPGRSQHQLGTAIDLGSLEDDFGLSGAGKWLAANAWKFGFSLSYPRGYADLTGYKYEPWHFRYTGRAAAALEHEYFGGIQQHFLQFLNATLQEFAAVRLRS